MQAIQMWAVPAPPGSSHDYNVECDYLNRELIEAEGRAKREAEEAPKREAEEAQLQAELNAPATFLNVSIKKVYGYTSAHPGRIRIEASTSEYAFIHIEIVRKGRTAVYNWREPDSKRIVWGHWNCHEAGYRYHYTVEAYGLTGPEIARHGTFVNEPIQKYREALGADAPCRL